MVELLFHFLLFLLVKIFFNYYYLHDGASIRIVITKHSGVAVVEGGLSDCSSGRNQPNMVWRCFLVISLSHVRISLHIVRNIRPQLQLLLRRLRGRKHFLCVYETCHRCLLLLQVNLHRFSSYKTCILKIKCYYIFSSGNTGKKNGIVRIWCVYIYYVPFTRERTFLTLRAQPSQSILILSATVCVCFFFLFFKVRSKSEM